MSAPPYNALSSLYSVDRGARDGSKGVCWFCDGPEHRARGQKEGDCPEWKPFRQAVDRAYRRLVLKQVE